MEHYFNEDVEGMADFDNAIGKRARRKMRRIRSGASKLKGGISKLREKKKRFHKKVLGAIKHPSALMNPKNRQKLHGMVKKMARKIDSCDCDTKGRNQRVSRGLRPKPEQIRKLRFMGYNADGEEQGYMSFVKKNKWLLVGGAVAVLFLTPMGKKLIAKIK